MMERMEKSAEGCGKGVWEEKVRVVDGDGDGDASSGCQLCRGKIGGS